MKDKLIEYFQQDENLDIPQIDMNYIIINRFIKYILNFLFIFMLRIAPIFS